ncbi:MAG: ABC transporter substrate-binding protein [Bacteroidota bacterium]
MIRSTLIWILSVGFLLTILPSCTPAAGSAAAPQGLLNDSTRIVSLDGALTEILFACGIGKQIVGVDVTSNYPSATADITKVGHNRNIQAEGVLSLNPDLIIGKAGSLKPELLEQLTQAGAEILLLEHTPSLEGTRQLITALCDTLDKPEVGTSLIAAIDAQLEKIQKPEPTPKAVFIYARGAGTLLVAGEGTQMESMFGLAGAENAVSGFEDFKPLTPEALLAADPEVVVMFESGLTSLEGESGLWEIPGLSETTAGKNKAYLTYDGQFLAGFGPRLGDAALALNQGLLSVVSDE